jgi:predicted ATP-grasp superfamily ATP-dependent carboligase
MQPIQQKILILDANQRSALAACRSLGVNPNNTIYTADDSTKALAGHSRYSKKYAQHPSPKLNPEAFCDWLKQFVADEKIDIVYPMTEITSQLVLMNKEQLENCNIPFADYDKVMAIADKGKLVKLAKALSIPYPETHFFGNSAQFDDSFVTKYPVVLKPCLSQIWKGDHWLNSTVHIAANESELKQLLQEKEYFLEHEFMLQEFIPGNGAGIFALYNQGEPVTFFAHQRLREKPPQGGVSVLSTSAPLNPQLKDIAEKLLTATGWHGVAMVEFRIADDGTPYLMEINTRFWGSLQLSIDSGVNFPELLLRISQGEVVAPVESYKIGQRLRWVLGDLDSIYIVFKDTRFSLGEKIERLFAFFTPHPFSTRHEVNRLNDMGPAWFELKSYVKSLIGR